ncbi:OmpH/Skp family outer membrane protein [Tunturibacter empetritectus]|uniref:Outer membrane protein n=1 Tax=Tunturiibacter lichenicola TaxID=2051959 RepID=A0A7W8J8M7_9BACT|nr:OmpH family outer membrane protein [Edaphobacter lichenicola]MBB5344561.1 outer membrane protein [Edaphobacter lichenicola]
MNRTFALVTALAAGMTSAAGVAQTAGTPAAPAAAPTQTAPAPAPAPAPVAPHAVPAKIATIEFEQVAAATNEGQRALQALQKKYEPKGAELQAKAQEIDTLKKQLQSAPATLTESERAAKLRTIDTKEKQLQRDGEDAQQAVGGEQQAAIGAVAKKLAPVVKKYVEDNGYTMLLDITGQQGGSMSVLWTSEGTDISRAVLDAYNASSGVAPPTPSAPSPAAHPHASAAPKPALPK